jgi:hypothetical protein
MKKKKKKKKKTTTTMRRRRWSIALRAEEQLWGQPSAADNDCYT